MDIKFMSPEVNVGESNYVLADVQVARKSDFGKKDTMFIVKTHLGHLLKVGDYALGYDFYGANSNGLELEKYKLLALPDMILVKKIYEEKRQKKLGKPRPWKLKSLKMEVDDTARGAGVDEEKMILEYELFLRGLEENPEMRFNISLYRDKEYQPSEMASVSDEDDVPEVPIEEVLAALVLNDKDVEDDSMRE